MGFRARSTAHLAVANVAETSNVGGATGEMERNVWSTKKLQRKQKTLVCQSAKRVIRTNRAYSGRRHREYFCSRSKILGRCFREADEQRKRTESVPVFSSVRVQRGKHSLLVGLRRSQKRT